MRITSNEAYAMFGCRETNANGLNPVIAARYFHYQLNCFFQRFIKSKAYPIGELVDYSIRENRFMSNNNLMVHEIVKSMLCIFNRTHWRLYKLILSSESSWMTDL